MKITRSFFFLSLLVLISISCLGQNLDIDILKPINAVETPFKNDFSRIMSNSVAPITIALPLALFADGLIEHNHLRKQDALYTAAGLAANFIVSTSLKKIIDRPRPFETWSFIVKRADEPAGESLPSEHTSFAFCTATSLSMRFPKWWVIVPSYLWAGAVAYSRMYLGVHYPSDVLLGAFIGSASAWGAWKIQKCMQRKSGPKTVSSKQAKLYF